MIALSLVVNSSSPYSSSTVVSSDLASLHPPVLEPALHSVSRRHCSPALNFFLRPFSSPSLFTSPLPFFLLSFLSGWRSSPSSWLAASIPQLGPGGCPSGLPPPGYPGWSIGVGSRLLSPLGDPTPTINRRRTDRENDVESATKSGGGQFRG